MFSYSIYDFTNDRNSDEAYELICDLSEKYDIDTVDDIVEEMHNSHKISEEVYAAAYEMIAELQYEDRCDV